MTDDWLYSPLNAVSADFLIDFLDDFGIPFMFALRFQNGEDCYDDFGVQIQL
jgi:hypothetical protein